MAAQWGQLPESAGAAARRAVVLAPDGVFVRRGLEDEYEAMLDRVTRAVHTIEHWEAGDYSHEEVARLATVAAGMHEPVRWPRTLEEADDVLDRATLTRDLIVRRDELGGKPSQEELDEPG